MKISNQPSLPPYFREKINPAKQNLLDIESLTSQFNQIWHFFNLLYSQKRPIYCSHKNKRYKAKIIELRKTDIILELKNFLLEGTPLNNIEIEFLHSRCVYQFDVFIKESWQEYICIEIPHHIQSKITQKNIQFTIDDLYLHFTLAYPPFPQTPFTDLIATDLHFYSYFSPMIEELQKDEPNLSLLCTMIADQLRRLDFTFNFEVFTESEKLSDIQKIMIDTQKTAFISDTRKFDSYCTPLTSSRLTNIYDTYTQMQKQSEVDAKKYCQDIQQRDIDQFTRSYAYAPFFLFYTAIGQLSIVSTVFDAKSVSLEDASLIDTLARFLSYGMSKSVVSKKYYRQNHTRVVNIAKKGLSIEIQDKNLLDYLTAQKYLKLSLQVKDQTLELQANVLNTLSIEENNSNRYNLSLQFYKMEPEANLVLEKLIYEQALGTQVKWELSVK